MLKWLVSNIEMDYKTMSIDLGNVLRSISIPVATSDFHTRYGT